MTIFKLAFESWVEDGKKRDIGHHVRAAHAELEGVVAGVRRRGPTAGRAKRSPRRAR